jgi:hypothetical protein
MNILIRNSLQKSKVNSECTACNLLVESLNGLHDSFFLFDEKIISKFKKPLALCDLSAAEGTQEP